MPESLTPRQRSAIKRARHNITVGKYVCVSVRWDEDTKDLHLDFDMESMPTAAFPAAKTMIENALHERLMELYPRATPETKLPVLDTQASRVEQIKLPPKRKK